MGSRSTGSVRQLPRVVAATLAIVGCPLLAVFALRSCGAIVSPPLLVLVGVALSVAASHAGAAYWRGRRAPGDLLFGELMVWGWIGRRRFERLVANAEELLGPEGAAEAAAAPRRRPGRRARRRPGRRARLLERLSRSLEARDPYTHGHSRRVARHSAAIAARLGLPPGQVAKVSAAAAIHDIGKIVTPSEVLEKPAALSEEEYELVKRHAAAGARMAAALGDGELTRIVRHHHERLDGNGYPDGLAGEEIPIGARIVAVADTFDALTSTRPYRPATAHREALAVLDREAGAQLDPDAVRAFRRHYSEHPRVALWALLLNGLRQLLQPLGERLGLGGAATAAKAAAVSLTAVAVTGVAAQPPVVPQRAVAAGAQQRAEQRTVARAGEASRPTVDPARPDDTPAEPLPAVAGSGSLSPSPPSQPDRPASTEPLLAADGGGASGEHVAPETVEPAPAAGPTKAISSTDAKPVRSPTSVSAYPVVAASDQLADGKVGSALPTDEAAAGTAETRDTTSDLPEDPYDTERLRNLSAAGP